MRGTPNSRTLPRIRAGIIPAYAGNTTDYINSTTINGDHPRVCGEHAPMAAAHTCLEGSSPRMREHCHLWFVFVHDVGSSPRMRGTRARTVRRCVASGIIPAYAGNTGVIDLTGQRFEDHPRVCGEHWLVFLSPMIFLGSSPRMRGTRLFAVRRVDDAGIIPRVCGEHCGEHSASFGVLGSSPRMRGTHLLGFVCNDCAGIIPAYAGNTASTIILRQGRGDHPRVCGEHAPADKAEAAVAGSSPRMRGTRPCLQWNLRNVGIIPAYAGNTRSPRSPTRCGWDHPRVCGEHQIVAAVLCLGQGSSPRMRGTPVVAVILAIVAGIIPAYAGNTGQSWSNRSAGGDHPRVCGEHHFTAP